MFLEILRQENVTFPNTGICESKHLLKYIVVLLDLVACLPIYQRRRRNFSNIIFWSKSIKRLPHPTIITSLIIKYLDPMHCVNAVAILGSFRIVFPQLH